MRWPKGFSKTFPYNNLKIRARVIDGKSKIAMVTSPGDVLNGKIADANRCRDANCTMRYSEAGLLPRKVFAAWFYKSMAYLLIGQNNGNYVVERYIHRDWPAIQKFDRSGKLTPAQRVTKFSGQTITLYPIPVSQALGQSRKDYKGGANRHNRGKPTGRVGVPRGMNARFITLRQWQENTDVAAGRSVA